MFQGYYNLTSGMLTQTRNLNVTSNNMSNVSTPGYKSDTFTAISFEEHMVYSANNKPMVGASQVGEMGTAVVADRNYIDFSQSGFTPTTSSFDVALGTSGFFVIQGADGEELYSRNGSFSLDGEGYLTLQGVGRVMGVDGEILLGTDDIGIDPLGNIFDAQTGEVYGTLEVVDFDDYVNDLTKETGGVFSATGEATPVDPRIYQRMVETSNVDVVGEMTEMMASQRALQSGAQIFTLYYELMGRIVSDLGPR